MQFADVHTRVVTAAILILILCVLESSYQIFPESRFVFPTVAAVLVALCSKEFVSLCKKGGSKYPSMYHCIPLASAAVFLIAMYISPTYSTPHAAVSRMLASGCVGFMIGLVILGAAGRRSLEEARIVSGEVFLSALLFGLGGTALISLSLLTDHSMLYCMISIVIANDTGAYFAGKRFGRNKLSVFISPGKSVEGTFAGLGAGIVTGVILGFLLTPFTFIELIFLSSAIGVSSQCTDLAKSFIKRIYGAKDSGTILPGHGGILDRLDGILGGSLALHIFIALVYG